MKVEIYQDVRGEWRWRLVADNGRVMGDSSESYTRATDAARAWNTIVTAVKAGEVEAD